MKNNITKRLSIWALVVAGILMIPLLANAPWTVFDFVFAGVILFGAATIFELATKNMKDSTHKIVIGILVAGTVICIWAMAVAD